MMLFGLIAARLGSNKAVMMALSFTMLAGMAFVYNPREVVSRVHDVDWALAALAVGGLASVHVLQVELWRVMSLALNGIRLPRRLAVTAYFAGQAFGGTTPGNLGGDFYRTISVKTPGVSWREALGPILGQRIISYGTVFCLAALAGGLSLASERGLTVPAFLGGALSVGLFWVGRRRLVQRLEQAVARFIPTYRHVLARAMSASRTAISLGIAFHLASVVLMYALLVSIGETPPLLPTVGLLLVARAVSLLPITPYGLGLQEGSLVLLLPALGVGPESALAVSLLARLGVILVVCIGLTCFVLERFSTKPESQGDAATTMAVPHGR